MAYTKTNWVNDSVPAINAFNLNKIEEGIYQAHQNIEILESAYAVNSIYITSTNTNPADVLGFGTWELFDKQFKSVADSEQTGVSVDGETRYFEPNDTNVSNYTFHFQRNARNIDFRLTITYNVAANDSGLELGTLNFEKLGIEQMFTSISNSGAFSDSGNGGVLITIDYKTGTVQHTDIITGTSTKGNSFALCGTIMITMDQLLDDFCDKFYWKRTA